MMKSIVYIDMDDTICCYSEAFENSIQANPEIKYPQSQPGFFENLKPMPGAIEAVHAFMNSEKYDPYILSAPSLRNPLSYTEKRLWIEKHLGYGVVDRLILCSHKGLLRGSIMIDDYAEGRGQEDFEGKLLRFGSDRYPGWNEIRNEMDL